MTDGEKKRDGMEIKVDENRGASAIQVPDVELREALKRLLGENGNRDMHILTHRAARMGALSEPKWYKKINWVTIFVAVLSPAVFVLLQSLFQ